MEHTALHETTYEELIMKGMPDVAVKKEYRRLTFERKSSGDEHNETLREGQIVMAMLTEFVNCGMKEVYGISLSPKHIRVYQVYRNQETIAIHRIFTTIHNGRNLLSLVKLIFWTRHVCTMTMTVSRSAPPLTINFMDVASKSEVNVLMGINLFGHRQKYQ